MVIVFLMLMVCFDNRLQMSCAVVVTWYLHALEEARCLEIRHSTSEQLLGLMCLDEADD